MITIIFFYRIYYSSYYCEKAFGRIHTWFYGRYLSNLRKEMIQVLGVGSLILFGISCIFLLYAQRNWNYRNLKYPYRGTKDRFQGVLANIILLLSSIPVIILSLVGILYPRIPWDNYFFTGHECRVVLWCLLLPESKEFLPVDHPGRVFMVEHMG